MQTFKTIRLAAIAGCKEANPLTKKTGWEYGGLILKADGGFVYQAPHTSESTGHIDPGPLFREYIPSYSARQKRKDIPAIIRKIKDAGIVSFYHIHPCDAETDWGRLSKYFSAGDMIGMITSGFPSAYMAVNCTGTVYEATPDTRLEYPDPDDYPDNPAALGDAIGKV